MLELKKPHEKQRGLIDHSIYKWPLMIIANGRNIPGILLAAIHVLYARMEDCVMAVIAIMSIILTSRIEPRQTWPASSVMTDNNYLVLLVWAICVLVFLCGVVALTEHSQWFNA